MAFLAGACGLTGAGISLQKRDARLTLNTGVSKDFIRISGVFAVILWLLSPPAETLAYGEKSDTLPNWQERAVLTLVNACRISPEAYRNAYLKSQKILLPANYPPVAPLFWQKELNAAARFHAVEMAGTCGMQHTCDGVTFDARIRQFYREGSYIGENIASGYTTPQQAMTAWLLDIYGSGDTALDASDNDGHRKNIMSKTYTVMGNGYYTAGSGKSSKVLWCQDFGSGKSSFRTHPVPSASHLFFAANTITFMLNYYDTSSAGGTVALLLDGTRHPMEKLFSGKGGSGTFSVQLPKASVCRNYWFEVADGKSAVFRYPDSGMLVTTGEGTCTQDFLPVSSRLRHAAPNRGVFPAKIMARKERLVWIGEEPAPEYSILVALDGRILSTVVWQERGAVIDKKLLSCNCLVARHMRNGSVMGYSNVFFQQER